MLFETFDPAAESQARQAALSVEVAYVDGNGLVVTPAGESDVRTSPILRRVLRQAIDSGSRHLVVDLDHLTFMDASTLGALAEARRQVLETDGTFEVRCQTPLFQRLLAIAGLDEALHSSA